MRAAIMQPYFFPYIGYFQLISSVDLFIVYDNIKYTKKGWINRNRMLRHSKDMTFTLPLKSDSDYLDVCERELAADFNRIKLLNQFKASYSRAPYFSQTYPLIEELITHQEMNLFGFLHYNITKICAHLAIKTEIVVSSGIAIDHNLKNQDKVLALCKAVGIETYVNSINGVDLYSKEAFREKGIALQFIKSKPIEYPQFGDTFIPWLSIIDVLMFNPLDVAQACVARNYELI